MEHKEQAIRAFQREEQGQVVDAKTSSKPAAEYFERFERRRDDKEDTEEISMDYWLSEEEESQQRKRRKWKSRLPKEPYVVQDAKGPKLRPAEGSFHQEASNAMTDECSQTS
jgi:hypothetical protein